MLKLYQFRPAFGLPNASPFCMKVETYLRMTGIPYECPRRADIRRAPKGKLPYIVDGGRVIADSSFIVDYLKSTYGDMLDAHLAPAERAVALAMQRLLEENLYWAVLYTRWVDAAGWTLTREAFFGWMKPPLSWIVPPLARRGLRRELHGHGMGRHAPEEIIAIGCRDLTALADYLADKPYLMGDRPTSLDAAGYAFLANLLWVPLDSSLKRHAAARANLGDYCARMKARYFS